MYEIQKTENFICTYVRAINSHDPFLKIQYALSAKKNLWIHYFLEYWSNCSLDGTVHVCLEYSSIMSRMFVYFLEYSLNMDRTVAIGARYPEIGSCDDPNYIELEFGCETRSSVPSNSIRLVELVCII